MTQAVIIVAGGSGQRFGASVPKQFLPLHGRPILMHTLEKFYQYQPDIKIIVGMSEDHWMYWGRLCKEHDCAIPHVLSPAGTTRFETVQQAIDRLTTETYVTVHDAVRPLLSIDLIASLFQNIQTTTHHGLIPTVPLVDSIRVKNLSNTTTQPVDRNLFLAVQTPQVFSTTILKEAYQQSYNEIFTDDASVVEHLGYTIGCIAGESFNIKITYPSDLVYAEAILSSSL